MGRMNDFKDNCPELPLTIDVGGELYYLGSEKPAELIYKSRTDFLKSFGTDSKVECLLRKYLYSSIKPRSQISVDSADKSELIRILKDRANQLKASQEFSSSILKNTNFQRIFLNIQKLIIDIQGASNTTTNSLFSLPDILPCTKAKKYIKQISPEKQNQLILAMAWYLLHPELTPKEIECDWAKLIKQMDGLNISQLVSRIKQGKANFTNNGTPYNYFKKLNKQSGGGIKSALDEAKELALQLQGDIAKKESEERIFTILDAIEAKKFLDRNPIIESHNTSIILGTDAEKLSKIAYKHHGGADVLNKPIQLAMTPLFHYFKVVYDPVYSFLEPITRYNSNDLKTVLLPQLLNLLYVCNNIKPTESTAGGAMSYGIYHIKNVDKDLHDFINNALKTTETKIESFHDNKDKRNFNLELTSLPNVRLSSFLSKGFFATKESETLPCIQILSVGNNLELIPEDEFMSEGGKEIVFKELNQLFNQNDLYIICSKTADFSTTPTNIPMNIFEIDFSTIDVLSDTFKYIIPDTYFNKTTDDDLMLENLVKLKNYVIFNDAELALSIFISLKHLI